MSIESIPAQYQIFVAENLGHICQKQQFSDEVTRLNWGFFVGIHILVVRFKSCHKGLPYRSLNWRDRWYALTGTLPYKSLDGKVKRVAAAEQAYKNRKQRCGQIVEFK